jgi:hypothetical protein
LTVTQVGEDDDGSDPEAVVDQESLVEHLRSAEETDGMLSTVDITSSFPGWAATVLALEQLADLKVGDYGVAPSAERILPAPS